MDLLDEFARVIRSLEAAGLEYALCGGLALAVHGVARATKDIDLLVEEASIPDALAPAGAADDRSTPVGEESREAWDSRAPYPTADGQVVTISRDALIALNVWAGRRRLDATSGHNRSR